MSSAKAAPANALFTKTQQRVLGLIYGNPEQSFYANEVVRSANMGRGTVRRELERLASAGLLNVTKAGNQLHYQANSDNPIYEDLVSIIRKTSALVDVLSSSLKPIEQQIQLAFVYDSIPKARQNIPGGVDLIVVSDSLSYAAVLIQLPAAEKILGKSISPTIYTATQFRDRLIAEQPFLTRIVKQPKVWIKGNDAAIDALRQSV